MSIDNPKVLFLTFWYPSAKHPSFGIFVKEHAKAVATTGVQIQLLAYQFLFSFHPFRIHRKTFSDEHGITTHVLVVESFFYRFIQINPWHNFLIIKNYLKKIKSEFAFDIIHANVVSPCGVAAMLLSGYFKVPYIITEHWTRLRQYLKNNKISFMGRMAYQKAAKVTAVSDDLRRTICKYFDVPEEKVVVVPNVVDPQLFHYEAGDKADRRVFEIVFIGNLRLPKRPDLVIQAIKALDEQLKNRVVLHVFGVGAWSNELHLLAKGIQTIWHGVKPKSELAKVLKKAHLLVHASENETFCLAVAEALCCGTPVVVSDLDVLKELVTEGQNGMCVPNDVHSFSTAIASALQMEWPYASIAANAGKRFDTKQVGNKFLNIYREIHQPQLQ